MQNCLVYISRNETHLGCGVLVEGALILTCRDVVAQEGNSIVPDQTFTISFPHCATPTDKPFETTATIIDACHGGQPNVDLVVLQPHRKPKLMRLQLAIDEDYEAGEAYVATALIFEENEFPERTTEMSGKISPTYFMPVTRLRKFTGELGSTQAGKRYQRLTCLYSTRATSCGNCCSIGNWEYAALRFDPGNSVFGPPP